MSKSGAKLAVIGFGAMGRALTQALLERGVFAAADVVVSDIEQAKQRAAAELGVRAAANNSEAARGAETVLLAVKPNTVGRVLDEMRPVLDASQLVVSIAAGVTIRSIESHLPEGSPVVRVMPNTPALVGAGASAFALGKSSQAEHARRVSDMLSAVGMAIEVPEELLDAVTGLSGSGPAYVYVIIEALSDAGVSEGLPRAVSNALAAQTVFGAAKMVIETGEDTVKLREAVTSPGGTTVAGIAELEKSGLRAAITNAVQAATRRSKELAG